MKLTFLGANKQVTGSRYCLEAGGSKVMVDCGMFQERKFLARNWEPCPVPPDEIDALLLTHVHIDHCGLLPRFVRSGYCQPILATPPSVDLAEVMLRDSAQIQVEDAEYKKRRHRKEHRRGKYPEEPLYTGTDVDDTLPLFRAVEYRTPHKINGAFAVTFRDAGHILGSAMLEITMNENGRSRRILFSGDVGRWDKPLLRNPTMFEQADYVVLESTYGDRDHLDGGPIEEQLAEVINDTSKRGGAVVIPTFAVERAQELMFFISRLVHSDRIPDIEIYLDSPMAVDVTKIFRQHRDCLDEEARELIASDEPPLRFPGLRMVRSAEQSRAINDVEGPCIIMSTSGMCTAGRIKHHLRRHIGRDESTILFVGYQGHGTLGRQILEGREEVRIHGRNYVVRARVDKINGFSGHTDRTGLLCWLGNLKSPPKQVFLTHGDEEASQSLAEHIADEFKWPVAIPDYRQEVELT